MEAGWANDHRKIGVTQPRIIAVVTVNVLYIVIFS